MFKSPFKPRQHYIFDYKPRYYDPRKERIEHLKKKYQNEEDSDSYEINLRKNDLRNSWNKAKSSGSDRATIIRLALIIAFLVGIVAYVFEIHTII